MKKSVLEEKLKKQLQEIAEEKLNKVIKDNYPIFKEKYEGKFFKIENSYSSIEKWWLYTKVTEIKPSHIYIGYKDAVLCNFDGFSFQTNVDKVITIESNKFGFTHSLGKEISEKEYNDAWNKMIDNINKLK